MKASGRKFITRTYLNSSSIPRTISREGSKFCVFELWIKAHTIDVTESAGFALLSMMQTTCPVNCDVAFVSTQASSTLYQVIKSEIFRIRIMISILPIEPPADIEQYSKSPSKTGQSSPTLSVKYLENAPSTSDRRITYIYVAL